MKKDFPFPLNVDIEEQVPVTHIKFDPKTEKIITVLELETRKTRYIDAPREHYKCKDGDHEFKVINGGRGLFQCKNCQFKRQVYPTTYKFINGKLIHKLTGKVI